MRWYGFLQHRLLQYQQLLAEQHDNDAGHSPLHSQGICHIICNFAILPYESPKALQKL
jgi:hypothetical protein